MIENSNKTKTRFCSLLIFSVFLLFNPNISVIDYFPDFIAWFILAKLFEKAADSSPYFEEARINFVRLGWVNIGKFISLFLIMLIRSKTLDNDVFALFSFTFAVFEVILSLSAVKNLFAALYYLAERSDASALIAPFRLSKRRPRTLTVDALREFTYFFLIIKSVLSVLSDLFLLTKVSESGQIVSISGFYPYVLILSQITGLVLGIVWFSRMNSYIKANSSEGKFHDALTSVAGSGFEKSTKKYERNLKIRKINSAISALVVSAFFTLELIFDNFNEINILPHPIYAISLIVAVYLLSKHTKRAKGSYIAGAGYFLISLAAYIISIIFHTKYDYSNLIDTVSAKKLYLLIEIFGILEFVSLTVFILLICRTLVNFVYANTGVSADSERYSVSDRVFHNIYLKKTYTLTVLAVMAGFTKCVNLFLSADVQLIFTDITDITQPVIYASVLPWFNLVVAFMSIIYIAYSFYYASELKDEIKIKYETE